MISSAAETGNLAGLDVLDQFRHPPLADLAGLGDAVYENRSLGGSIRLLGTIGFCTR